MTTRKPILVTGFNRSGTTWVGHMIAVSPSVGYIHEPFNLFCHPGICNAPFSLWFTYVTNENETPFYRPVKRTLEFKYNLMSGLKTIRSLNDLTLFIKTLYNTKRRRYLKMRPLMKDPVAIFSAEWLASRFDMQVIVTMRHPAAYVSSIKRLRWGTRFGHLLSQELLVRDHLYPFETEIREVGFRDHDIVDNAILSWKVMWNVICKYMRNHPDWIFLRHENISLEPVQEFTKLYSALGLEFNKDVERAIRKHSDASNSNDDREPFCISRNSKTNVAIWKARLSKGEIRRVREQLGEIAYPFYPDEYW